MAEYNPESEHRERFGQHFTPPRIAALMCDWCLLAKPKTVLDPSTGTGNLLTPFLASRSDLIIRAMDLDTAVLKHFGHLKKGVQPEAADFLRTPLGSYDAVTMNPPYIRHREIVGRDEDRSRLSVMAGVEIPRSANLYVYFCIKAALELSIGGRGAFLIPSEWMNANFALSFKDFLIGRRLLKEIVVFSGCSSVFNDALTTASILLIERDK